MKIIQEGATFRAVKASPDDRLRVLVLSSDDPQHRYLTALLSQRFHVIGAIVEPSRLQQSGLWKRRKYVDWVARYYQVKRQKYTGRSKYRARYFKSLMQQLGEANVPVTEVESINAAASVSKVRELKPDVTIVCGTMFIGRKMIEASNLIINVHGGCLPEYKGNHCVFFAYYNGDYENIGATLHLVTLQLDGGEIIEVVRPPIYPHDNDEHLYCRSVHLAMERLIELLDDFEARGTPLVCQTQEHRGRMYRHRSRKPHHDALVWLRRRLGIQKVPHIPARERPHNPEAAAVATRAR